MGIGKKSLLFGAHQFVLHPVCVLLAWVRLYGWPTWPELVCILVHDWGYWWATDIDGPTGTRHPEFGAGLAARWFWPEHRDLVLYHSRTYARRSGAEPSRLCWADKLGVVLMPAWMYLPLAWLTGELAEYRANAADSGFVSPGLSHFQWYRCVMEHLRDQVLRGAGDQRPG